MAKILSKEENQIHTLGTLLAAGEDKSWKVRLAFARNFGAFTDSFGHDLADANMIQTFCFLLNDSEAEVKLAAVNSIPSCLKNLSMNKIVNLIVPTLKNGYADATAQFKAGTATALTEIAKRNIEEF